jgi:Holliday junction resolvase RusA-like endonuclease
MAGNKKENKSSKVIYEKRVSIIVEMLLSGLKRFEIMQNIATHSELKQWKVCERQIDNYIKAASDIIQGGISENQKVMFEQTTSRYDFLYKKLINVKDYKSAVLVVEKKANLHGLLKTKLEISEEKPIFTPINLDVENSENG